MTERALAAKRGAVRVFRKFETLASYVAKRSDLETVAGELMSVVASGAVKIQVNQTFALADAAKAHIALESRQTTGSTVLIP